METVQFTTNRFALAVQSPDGYPAQVSDMGLGGAVKVRWMDPVNQAAANFGADGATGAQCWTDATGYGGVLIFVQTPSLLANECLVVGWSVSANANSAVLGLVQGAAAAKGSINAAAYDDVGIISQATPYLVVRPLVSSDKIKTLGIALTGAADIANLVACCACMV
jgi:hypothetical protein